MGCGSSSPFVAEYFDIRDRGASIDVRNSRKSDDEVIKLLRPKVTEIELYDCPNITNKTIMAIAKTCHSIEAIGITECPNLTEDSLKAIKECKMLQILRFVDCTNLMLTEDSGACWVSGQPLKELVFVSCGKLSDKAVQLIVNSFPKLEKLDLEDYGLTSLPDDFGDRLKCLTVLNIGYNNLTSLPDGFGDRLKGLTHFDISGNNLTSLPEDFGDRLKCLKYLDISDNNLTKLPRSIANLAGTCDTFLVYGNPLQEPPIEIADQGLQAVKRYFDAVDKAGSTVCKKLKVVLLGDGGVGKTSIRKAIQGLYPALQHEKDRTIYLDIVPHNITLESGEGLPEEIDEITLVIYDCGGQEDYAIGQSPFISKGAFFVLVVPADIDTNNAKSYEDKVLRFLVMLQNKAPGAQVQLVLSKADLISDESKRKEIVRWLLGKINETVEWWHKMATNAGGAVEKLQILPSVLDFSVENYDKARVETSTILTQDAQIESRFGAVVVELVRNDKLPSVGQRIPKSWWTHWSLLYEVSKMGINADTDKQDLFKKAVADDASPFSSVETSDEATNGAYCDLETLKELWNEFCQNNTSVFERDSTFDDALELLNVQGSVFKDYGLVFLHPSFVTTLVKPLIDHSLTEERVKELRDDLDLFARGDQNEFEKLIHALKNLAKTGKLDGIVLPFLWRDVKELKTVHYDKVLNMLIESGFIFASSHLEGTAKVPVVLFKLPRTKPSFKEDWPDSIPEGQQQVELHVELRHGCPPNLAGRFAARTHALGECLHAWFDGAVVSESNDRRFRCERVVKEFVDEGGTTRSETRLEMLVREKTREEKVSFLRETLSMFQSAVEFLRMEKNRLPGLSLDFWVVCPRCRLQKASVLSYRFPWIEFEKEKSNEGPFCHRCREHIEIDLAGQRAHTFANDISNLELLVILTRQIRGVTRRLDGIDSQLLTIKNAVLGIANYQHEYPAQFYILPSKPEKDWRSFFTAPDKIFNRDLMVVFVCAGTKKLVKYDGKDGLVFRVPKKPVAEFLGTVNDFWARFGPIIKVSAMLVQAAVKTTTSVDMSALVPAGFGKIQELPKFLNEFALKAGEYADAALTIVGAERSTLDSIKPDTEAINTDGLDLDNQNLVKAVGTSYIQFGRFLDEIGFDKQKLNMKVAMVGESMEWVSGEYVAT